MDIVFLSVVHPGSRRFLGPFLDSVMSQTDSEFRVLLGLDGVSPSDIGKMPQSSRVEFIDVTGMTIAQNRFHLIDTARQRGFQVGVMGDSDDLFSPNRVEVIRSQLGEVGAAIVVTELLPFQKTAEFSGTGRIGRRLSSGHSPHPLLCNYFGFSNTAFTLESFRMPPLPPEELLPVDWYFFLHLLLDGLPVRVATDAVTAYRQHAGNTVGLTETAGPSPQAVVRQRDLIYSALSHRLKGVAETLVVANRAATDRDSDTVDALWWEPPLMEVDAGLLPRLPVIQSLACQSTINQGNYGDSTDQNTFD